MELFFQICVSILLLTSFGFVENQSTSMRVEECVSTTTCPCCSAFATCLSNRSCGGTCKDGYHGEKCWNRCPSNCLRCVDAQQGGGVSNCTLCVDGYFVTDELYQCQSACSVGCKTCVTNGLTCTSCHDGYYQTGSNRCVRCIEPCETSSSKSLCSSCKVGFYFDLVVQQCQKCNPLCYFCNSSETCFCSNGCADLLHGESLSSCLVETNLCTYGCKMNYMSSLDPNGNTCDKCIDGNFGINCNFKCSANCDLKECERISGNCFGCKAGFYGPFCDLACPSICKTTCEKTLGSDSCQSVYSGLNCELNCQNNCQECIITNGSCTTCIYGFFGDECEKTCSENCKERKCKKTDGSCECVSGYTGPTCDARITTSTKGPSLPPSRVVPEALPYNVGAIVGITMAIVVIMVGIIGVSVWFYRWRKHRISTGNRMVFSITQNVSDINKVTKELNTIEKQISVLGTKLNTLTSTRSELEAKLEGLKSNVPYQHTVQADAVEDIAYEMLQQGKNESHYSSLK